MYIYILRLEEGKYYVGLYEKSLKPPSMEEIVYDVNNDWVNTYSPIELLEVIPLNDAFDVNMIMFKLMNEFGINNVRGGKLCHLALNEDEHMILAKLVYGTTDKCYQCGHYGHYKHLCDESKWNELKKTCMICHSIDHHQSHHCPLSNNSPKKQKTSPILEKYPFLRIQNYLKLLKSFKL